MTEYIVRSAFSGEKLSQPVSLDQARKIAAQKSFPTHIWTTTGGMFGLGKVVEHCSGQEVSNG